MTPIDVPHHVIPGAPATATPAATPASPTTPSSHVGNAAEAIASIGGTGHALASGGTLLFAILAVVGIALAVVALSIIFLRVARPAPLKRPRGPEGQGEGFRAHYQYPGLRAALHEVFLWLRTRAAQLGAPLNATAREVAKILGSGEALRFARLYEYLMYSRVHPRASDVEEARRLAVNAVEGARHGEAE